MSKDVVDIKDENLMFSIIKRLSIRHRECIKNSINDLGKLYIWSLNPDPSVDFELIKMNFNRLPDDSKVRSYKYLFCLFDKGLIKETPNFFLQKILEMLKTNITLENKSQPILSELSLTIYRSGLMSYDKNSSAALYAITKILKSKIEMLVNMKNDEAHIEYSLLDYICGFFNVHIWHILNGIKEFFFNCGGWRLLDFEPHTRQTISLYGEIIKIKSINKYKNCEYCYKVYFYDEELDYRHNPIGLNSDECIKHAVNVLKKNFNYVCEKGGYIIPSSDVLRLKEFVRLYHIEDKCGLFKESLKFGENIKCNYDIPNYANRSCIYKNTDFFICNSSPFISEDPSWGIPFRWCRKYPCTCNFMFLKTDSDWKNFKFADLLWILLKDKIDMKQLWSINSEISSFINEISKITSTQNVSLKSELPKESDNVGKWTKDMSVFTSGIYSEYYDDDDCDYDELSYDL